MADVASVYVIASGVACHKIGIAYDPEKRLRALNGASPTALRLVMSEVSAKAREVEAMAHWHLRSVKLQGEWFAVAEAEAVEAVRDAIQRVAAGERPGGRVAGAGRPVGDGRPTHVRLPPEHMNRIDGMVEKYRRAAFIREAVLAELERREKAKS